MLERLLMILYYGLTIAEKLVRWCKKLLETKKTSRPYAQDKRDV